MAQKFGNGRWVKEGFLDNRVHGLVVGRIILAVWGPVEMCLKGDFKGEIAGKAIAFHNSLVRCFGYRGVARLSGYRLVGRGVTGELPAKGLK